MHVYINGEDQGVAARGVPKHVFGVIDLFGMVEQVSITSTLVSPLSLDTENNPLSPPSIRSLDSQRSHTSSEVSRRERCSVMESAVVLLHCVAPSLAFAHRVCVHPAGRRRRR